MQPQSLKVKMFFFILVICAVPLFFSGTFINNLVFEKLQNDYQIHSNESMKQIQLVIKEGIISPSHKAVTLLARNSNTINLAREVDNQVILTSAELDPNSYQYLTDFCNTYSNVAGVGLGTDVGGYFNYPDTVLDNTYDPRTRPWYIQGMSNPGNPMLTDPYMRTDGKVVIAVAHTFSDRGVSGVIVAGWNLHILEDAIRDVKAKDKSTTVLVLNQKNKIVASPDNPEWLLKTSQELNIQGLDELLDWSNSLHRIYVDGREKVLFVNVSEDTGWKVLSIVDANELMAESRKITRNISFAIMVTLTFILFGLYYLARSITHPIDGLVAGAHDVILGNLGKRISINRRDELGTLANNINQIVDDLIDKYDKIQSQAEQLQRREVEYRTLVENAQDIIIRSDSNHVCEYINPVIKIYTGVDTNKLIGKDISQAGFPQKVCIQIENIWQLVLETNTEKRDTFEIEYPDEESLYFQIHAVPEHNPDGAVETVLSIIRNITEQKRMEKQIARLDRLYLVGEIAASIGHEVRNPLTVIKGFLQMMQQRKVDVKRNEEYLSIMIEEIDRVSSIINEFLFMAKDKAVHLTKQNLNSIIQSIFPLLQADAQARNSIITLQLEKVPELPLDEKEIRQLLLNLVRNGLEAMTEGGRIKIRTFYDELNVVLVVQDNGGGIPNYVIERFGIPFTSTKPNGVGLGLSICHSIAARHNAKIEFKTSIDGTEIYVVFSQKSL